MTLADLVMPQEVNGMESDLASITHYFKDLNLKGDFIETALKRYRDTLIRKLVKKESERLAKEDWDSIQNSLGIKVNLGYEHYSLDFDQYLLAQLLIDRGIEVNDLWIKTKRGPIHLSSLKLKFNQLYQPLKTHRKVQLYNKYSDWNFTV